MLQELKKKIEAKKNPKKAKILERFFKTGKGEYGEGDIFWGIVVPEQRKLAKKYAGLKLSEIQVLLSGKIHEKRLISLMILIQKYKKADEKEKEAIVSFYLKNTKNINNWDLVDLSAHYILGEWFFDKEKRSLYKLAKSNSLWERRIAIMSTFHFIRLNEFSDSLKISEILLSDKEDLIHKAVGWMLREVGKRDIGLEEEFLEKNIAKMPRTMLRYAIEKFPKEKREFYLHSPLKYAKTAKIS